MRDVAREMAQRAIELGQRERTMEIVEYLRGKFFNQLAREIEKEFLEDVKIK